MRIAYFGRELIVEASGAMSSIELIAGTADALQQAALAQEMERVGIDGRANLFDRLRRSDELLAVRRIDAVEARIFERRLCDPHVHFLSANFA